MHLGHPPVLLLRFFALQPYSWQRFDVSSCFSKDTTAPVNDYRRASSCYSYKTHYGTQGQAPL